MKITNNDGSELHAMRWSKLSRFSIKNWHLNRPHDNTRLPEIIHQLKEQDYVDGIVYIAKKEDTYVCYDGIHRIEALKLLRHDIDCTIDHKIIVHYTPIYNERAIKQRFESLNKCVPVPEIYTSAHKELDVKNTIEIIIKYLTEKYPSMFKASRRPNIPHENRDLCTDKIHTIIKELSLESVSHDKIIDLIEQFNFQMRERISSLKLTVKQMHKCGDTNCYLFIRKDWDRSFIVSYYNKLLTIRR